MPAAPEVLSLPDVADAIERSADAAAARTALTRLVEAHPASAAEIAEHPDLRGALVALAAASRSLTSAVIADPALLRPLCDPGALRSERSAEDYLAAAAGCGAADDPAALRRWKRRELLRIAARDLLGLADLPAVGRELAALAAACLAAALRIAAPRTRLAVIGMGKLGGHELNYASDVDVLFVHEGPADDADHAARRLLSVMADPSPDGIVFRTDADLRPEGRDGPLSRSLDSYRAYYERWAQTWEFQALIKAEPVAGDVELGGAFMELAAPHVWPAERDPGAVREVRAMKARSEAVTIRAGTADRELKRGRGGIRDIEFAVQLLQFVHGCQDAALRSPTTLDALDALVAGGYVAAGDASRLADAYRFLRTVEHRLQLVDEQQTHTLPSDAGARTRLARVLGYRDRAGESALELFEADHRAHQTAARSIHERLFFGPLLDALAGRGPMSVEATQERLAAFGFRDRAAAAAATHELTRGLSRQSRLMQQLLPVLLEWCSDSPDPDLALLQLRRLAEGPARSAALATAFRDVPGAAQRTCRLVGTSRLLGDALRRQPDFVAILGDDTALEAPRPRERLTSEALETLDWRSSTETRREGLRRFKRRELLRIGARDVLGFAVEEEVGAELAALADACVEGALRSLGPDLPFAVIGMGRLGGYDLSYASDIDVLFVYDGHGPRDFQRAEELATALMTEIGATTAEGQTFRIDAQLRPEGKRGPLARSLDGYRAYYERWALTWEFQALLKARAVAGDVALAERFAALVQPFVYREPFPAEEVREVRRMKVRIERERIPPGDDPQFHLKLGRGSLSDVEFTAQLLQLRHGAAHADLRTPSTIGALRAAVDLGLLDRDDADALVESYEFCARARNAHYLVSGSTRESLPTDGWDAERLGRALGYVAHPQTSLRGDYRRVTRRARRVVERVFYGRDEAPKE